MDDIRIGTGFDVHRLVEGRPLILGGVAVPFQKGLLGHSDADVLLHALSDALLGALALGDLGGHFPDTDPRYAGADSRELLRQVYSLVKARGFYLVNADVMVMAEAPKIAPHVPAMRAGVAAILESEEGRISIKATTLEKLGFVGRGEGIAAQASVLISRKVK